MSDTKLTDECCGMNCCEHENLGQEVTQNEPSYMVKRDLILRNGSGGFVTETVSNPISEIIRARVLESGDRFFGNDNIAKFINPGETDLLVDEVASKLDAVLRSLVIDIDNDHNTQDTARRVAKMYINEIYSGRYRSAPEITSFPNEGYQDLYTTGPITIRSQCSHHNQPITGGCWVGIFPEKKVIGLSKFNRLVYWISERPQIQEEMTTQIADALEKYAETPNVAVLVRASHGCMSNRGVKEGGAPIMSTAIMRGKFREDPHLKDEFYKNVR